MSAAVKINKFGKFDMNPRGNLWVKDENRFGHKLLSKMGWSQGKGLGKNEDGIAEHLKVKMKSGNTGVGWSEKMPLAAEHDEYDAVLANLNEKFTSSENKTKKEDVSKSLVLRSQQFKNRLHYGKFVRGKDVFRYSENDMNSIFVTKKLKSESTVRVKSTVTNVDSSSSDDETAKTTPIFKSQLSMKEYFEMKMKKKSGNVLNGSNAKEYEYEEESFLKNDVSSRNKSKNLNIKIKLEPETSEESSNEDNLLNGTNITEYENTKESYTENDVPSRNKSKNRKVKLETETPGELSNEGNLTNGSNIREYETAEESYTKKDVSSRNKSKHRKIKLEPETLEELSNEGNLINGSSIREYENAEVSFTKKDVSSRSKNKNKKSKLEPETSEESSNEGNLLNGSNITKNEKAEEYYTEKDVSSRNISKNKKIKLEPETSEESSSEGNLLSGNNTPNTENAEESYAEKKVSSKKKIKTHRNTEKLELDLESMEVSSGEGETPELSTIPAKTLTVEEPSTKKESSSRKRSRTTETTEKSKRLKLDLVSVKEFSDTKVTENESDDLNEISKLRFDTLQEDAVNEVSSKKKRKNSKKAEKRKREVVDTPEDSSSESSETEQPKNTPLASLEVKVSSKKHKKLASEKSESITSSVLTKLRTCLKGGAKYSLEKESKRVSFNEHVFYKVINSDAEEGEIETESRQDSEEGGSVNAEDGSVQVVIDARELSEDEVEKELSNGESSKGSGTQKADELCDSDSDDRPNCLDLPKCDNYNSWLENQRIASRMKLYQNMIKKIKKHPVLKTSNLLDLKGYGNWGF